MKNICVDTGVICLFFSRNPTKKVMSLMEEALLGKINISLPRAVLVEAYYQVCRREGKEVAQNTVVNFFNKFPLDFVEIDEKLIIFAGQLKCQHSSSLSYIDCMGIAVALSKKITFHTTEKNLKKIPHNVLSRLKVETYSF